MVFPGNMNDDFAKEFPPTYVYTCGNDVCYSMSLELANVLKRNGKLLELFVQIGQLEHAFHFVFSHPCSDEFWDSQVKMFNDHLF